MKGAIMSALRFGSRFTALSVVLALSSFFAGTPPAAAQTVMVNGQQLYLNPGPIERSGRVFVPLRSIFERMGASVVYQSGRINATKNQTTVSLTIGSTQATVNGQSQILDVAPFIVGATTYVPLRFVAQSLGADVGYNSSTNVVSITHAGGGGGGGGMRPPNPPPPMPPVSQLYLTSHQPTPNSQIANRTPVISASFSRPVRTDTVRVWLDGYDITSGTEISGFGIYHRTRNVLSIGSHTVRVAGTDVAGMRFDRQWTFSVIGSGPPPGLIQLRAQQPAPGAKVSDRFALISAQFTSPVQTGSIRVWLDGADRTGQCGISSTQFSYRPPAPLDFGSHTVRVTGRGVGGSYFDRSWSFSIVRSGPATPLTINQPSADQAVGWNFTVQGSTAGNAKVDVTAGPAAAPMGLFAGSTTAGPQGNFRLNVTMRPMPGVQAITLKVTATNPSTSEVVQRTMQLRVSP
jgi:hypothetical protein